MEAAMAIHDYEPIHRERYGNAFDDARRAHQELDKGTLWAGAMLGAALVVFMAYMLLVGPNT
jgi:hypothetical protein